MCTGTCLPPHVSPVWDSHQGSPPAHLKKPRAECNSPYGQLGDPSSASQEPVISASVVEVKSPNKANFEISTKVDCNNSVERCLTDQNGNVIPCSDGKEDSDSLVYLHINQDTFTPNCAAMNSSTSCKVKELANKELIRVKKLSLPSREKLNAMHEKPFQNGVKLNTEPVKTSLIIPPVNTPPVHLSVSQVVPRMLVRRSKSEGHVTSATIVEDECKSPVAEVYYDATVNDRIWSKLDAGNHRDSMSSSSSMSSNDTVIDISLPNLAQKSLPDLDSNHLDNFESILVKNSMRPRSATTSGEEMAVVSKSKSNPNLKCSQQNDDELLSKPLSQGPEGPMPPMMARRHTWSRLYMESLKQSSSRGKVEEDKAAASQTKCKSLGDLTSDDISCNFESKYHSISRSFLPRSLRAQRQPTHMRTSAKSQDDLTEQLRKLTSFQQENDISSPTGFEPVESEADGLCLLRRTSSRSQSRVRYIANRAKQAQERQRLQSMCHFNGTPIEERGIPEGACSVSKGTCTDSVSSPSFGVQMKSQENLICDTDVFFMLKL